MFGVSSWGTTHWAAVDGSYLSAVTYTPGTITITFQELGAPLVKGISPITFQQTVREVLRDSPVAGRLRVLQVAREVLRGPGTLSGTFQARQVVREVLRSGSVTVSEFHARQVVREVLRSSIKVAFRRRQLVLPNVGQF